MTEFPGAGGLILNEPLLWEQGRKGRSGYSLPRPDVPAAALPAALAGEGPDFPDLSEAEVVRHYTRLSQWNFSVDAGFYPLGSCTMKYNPKTNERQAAVPGFAGAHPLLPAALCQGGLELMAALECLLAEITGMEGDTICLNDLFRFQQQGVDENGNVFGRFEGCDVRPRLVDKLVANGINIPADLFQRRVLETSSMKRKEPGKRG